MIGSAIDEDAIRKLNVKRDKGGDRSRRRALEGILRHSYVGDLGGMFINDMLVFDMAVRVRNNVI